MGGAWMLPEPHREITDWLALALQTEARPTHLAKIVRRKPTHLGFCTAWLDPTKSVHNLAWRHPWPPDIITDLVSSKNM